METVTRNLTSPFPGCYNYVYDLETFELLGRSDNTPEYLMDLKMYFDFQDANNQTTRFGQPASIQKMIQNFLSSNPGCKWREYLTIETPGNKEEHIFLKASLGSSRSSVGQNHIIIQAEVINFEQCNMDVFQKILYCYKKNENKDKLGALTPTEQVVFAELLKGKSVTEIADEMFRSRHTIESHSASIKKKLGCKKIHDLMILGYKIGATGVES